MILIILAQMFLFINIAIHLCEQWNIPFFFTNNKRNRGTRNKFAFARIDKMTNDVKIDW